MTVPKAKDERIDNAFDTVTLSVHLGVVNISLNCGDSYKALLLYEDITDRIKTQNVRILLNRLKKQ